MSVEAVPGSSRSCEPEHATRSCCGSISSLASANVLREPAASAAFKARMAPAQRASPRRWAHWRAVLRLSGASTMPAGWQLAWHRWRRQPARPIPNQRGRVVDCRRPRRARSQRLALLGPRCRYRRRGANVGARRVDTIRARGVALARLRKGRGLASKHREPSEAGARSARWIRGAAAGAAVAIP